MMTSLRRYIAIAVFTFCIGAFALPTHAAKTWTVNLNTDEDSGACDSACTFREALHYSQSGDTIKFILPEKSVITLKTPLVVAGKNLTITGPGTDALTIDGGSKHTPLSIESGNINMSYLTFAHIYSSIGVISNYGSLTLSNVIFKDNQLTNSFTFGVVTNNGTLTMNYTDIKDTTLASGAGGVAVYNHGTATIGRGSFSNNPRAVYNAQGKVTISKSTFAKNYKGAIYGGSGTVDIKNSTFSENSDKSTIENSEGLVLISHSTFYKNVNTTSNSATLLSTNSGAIKINSSILGGNTKNCLELSNGQVTSEGYNIDDKNSCAFDEDGDLINTNPGFSSKGLQNNGGPTKTVAITYGSAAMDMLTDCSDITDDQRSASRPQGDACDAGAYELALVRSVVGVQGGQVEVTYRDSTKETFPFSTEFGDGGTPVVKVSNDGVTILGVDSRGEAAFAMNGLTGEIIASEILQAPHSSEPVSKTQVQVQLLPNSSKQLDNLIISGKYKKKIHTILVQLPYGSDVFVQKNTRTQKVSSNSTFTLVLKDTVIQLKGKKKVLARYIINKKSKLTGL